MSRVAWLLVLGAFLALEERARARQDAASTEEWTRVEVHVSAASGRDVFLDRGREAGLAADDRVELELAGEGRVEARVRALARTSARAELVDELREVPVGTRGFVLVPSARLGRGSPGEPAAGPAASAPAPADARPSHPAWTHPPEAWTSDTPLLAPVAIPREEEREIELHGRAYLRGTWNEDAQRDFAWQELRTGLWLDASNVFGRGGGLRFSAQGLTRESDLGELGRDSDSELWIERFSYWEGGTLEHPDRFELGRFLQKEYPELGLLDGAEYVHRTEGGHHVGGSVGFLPEPFPGNPSGKDLAAALFYRAFLGEQDELALGGALQATWHEGAQDRTLALASLDWNPEGGAWLRSIAFLDVYGSDDGPKASGAELTELQVQGGWREGSRWAVSASARHRTWPYLLRDEFEPVSAEEIADSRTDRVWVSGWVKLSALVTLHARLGWWQDEETDGSEAELGASLIEPWEGGRVDLFALVSEGAYSSTRPGLRASVAQSLGRVSGSLAWTLSDYEQSGFLGQQAQLLQQSVRAALDWRFAPGWSLGFGAQRLFGDELDAWVVDLQLQRSF